MLGESEALLRYVQVIGRSIAWGVVHRAESDFVGLFNEWTSKNEQIDLVIDVSIAGETNTYVR